MEDIRRFFRGFLIVLIILVTGLASGVLVDRMLLRPNTTKVEIKTIYKDVMKYEKVLQKEDTESLWKAYQSPIKLTWIAGEVRDDVFPVHIRATDTYKTTEQTADFVVTSTSNWKMTTGISVGALIAGSVLVYKVKH